MKYKKGSINTYRYKTDFSFLNAIFGAITGISILFILAGVYGLYTGQTNNDASQFVLEIIRLIR